MKKTINGIQQIGIGVVNAREVFNWYYKTLGFDILVFEDESTAALMLPYTDGKPRERLALLALNMIGGGGLEIWQYTSRTPQPPINEVLVGDLGVNLMKLRSPSISQIHEKLATAKASFLSEITSVSEGKTHFFLTDPWNNHIQVVEDDYVFSSGKNSSGGVMGAMIGVSEMEASIKFYKELLGYDQVVYDKTGIFQDLRGLPGGDHSFRRVLLRHSPRPIGGFGELLGPSEMELVQVLDRKPNKIFEKRLWGDLGYIHLCFDISGMDQLREECKALGHPFTVDSSDSFDMGEAAGHFSYVEDPDGMLIEFVETHKVPILKKLGIYINLKKRSPHKPLPKWIVKAMQVHRVKGEFKIPN